MSSDEGGSALALQVTWLGIVYLQPGPFEDLHSSANGTHCDNSQAREYPLKGLDKLLAKWLLCLEPLKAPQSQKAATSGQKPLERVTPLGAAEVLSGS